MADALPRTGFIGAGRVGGALALALAEAGYPVTTITSLRGTSSRQIAARIAGCVAAGSSQEVADLSDLVIIATPDAAIGRVAANVRWQPGVAVVHTSGSESRSALAAAEAAGAVTGSLHPLQTFADVEQARANLAGSVFGVEAEGHLLGVLRGMVAALNGTAIELRGDDKVLYHAAAAMVSNYTVTLMKLATDLWLRFGVDRAQSLSALMPLLRGTVANLDSLGLPEALTGPVARGDAVTVAKHLAALDQAAPEIAAVYRELASQTIPIALAKGSLSDEAAAAIRSLIGKPLAQVPDRSFTA